MDLTRWRELRSYFKQRSKILNGYLADGLADLYFDGFGPASFARDPAQRPTALVRLKEEFLKIEVPVAILPAKEHIQRQHERWVRERQVGYWQEPPFRHSGHPLPPPFCERASRLRLHPEGSLPAHSFFDEFEALARRVEGRHRWEQPEF